MLTSVAGTGLAHSLAIAPFQSRGPQSSVMSLLQVTFLAAALQWLLECYQMGDRWFNCHSELGRRTNSLFRRHYVSWLRSLRRRKRMRRCRSIRRRRTKGCPRPSTIRRRKALGLNANNAGVSAPLAELNCCIDKLVGEFNFCNQHQDHQIQAGKARANLTSALSGMIRFHHWHLHLSQPNGDGSKRMNANAGKRAMPQNCARIACAPRRRDPAMKGAVARRRHAEIHLGESQIQRSGRQRRLQPRLLPTRKLR